MDLCDAVIQGIGIISCDRTDDQQVAAAQGLEQLKIQVRIRDQMGQLPGGQKLLLEIPGGHAGALCRQEDDIGNVAEHLGKAGQIFLVGPLLPE